MRIVQEARTGHGPCVSLFAVRCARTRHRQLTANRTNERTNEMVERNHVMFFAFFWQEIMIVERTRERRKSLMKERAKGQAVIQYLTQLQRGERSRSNLLRAKGNMLSVRPL